MTLPDLKWTPHPLFPVPTATELRATPVGRDVEMPTAEELGWGK